MKRASGLVFEEVRFVLKMFLERVIRNAVIYTEVSLVLSLLLLLHFLFYSLNTHFNCFCWFDCLLNVFNDEQYAKRKTVTVVDVVYALRRENRHLLGFGGL